MENDNKSKINLEKIGFYVAVFAAFFMFWQAWRDIHNDMSDLKERMKEIEVHMKYLQKDKL